MKYEFNKNSIARNLIFYYKNASKTDVENGLKWYSRANTVVNAIHEVTGIDNRKISGVIAALSPAVEWNINLRQAWQLIEAYKTGKSLDKLSFSTYGIQVKKAIKILTHNGRITHNMIFDILGKTARKTKAFYWNILYPYDFSHVTIDRHITRAAGLSDGVRLTEKRYNTFEKLIRKMAAKQNITSCQLQAIIWLSYKNYSDNPLNFLTIT